jgi:uncharacterized membrane protein HdeD (DUF308 family)
MDMMAKAFQPPWGASVFSAIVAIATGVVIFGLGAPPAILVPVSWATAGGYIAMKPRIKRRLDQR